MNEKKKKGASSLLLSSIDAARRQFVRDGEEILGRALAGRRAL